MEIEAGQLQTPHTFHAPPSRREPPPTTITPFFNTIAKHNNMAPVNDADKEERLKAALWYSVGQTIDSVTVPKDANATPHFIGALSEMLWAQIGAKTC